jgi:SAM-dependent methyltransferase
MEAASVTGTGFSRFRRAAETIFAADLETRPGETNLRGYYGDLPAQVERFDRYCRDNYALAGGIPVGREVLEVGCGMGIGLVHLACYGAEAHGVEIIGWQVDLIDTYKELLGDLFGHIHAREGSADDLPHADEAFDLLLSVEAISHYRDYYSFLGEARRVLRPGGVLLISDGNNALNPWTRRRNRRIWDEHERPDFDADSAFPYYFVRVREQIIHKHFPTLPAHEFALRTVGMVEDEILQACESYLAGGAHPQSYYRGELTVHPKNGMVMERLLNPLQLAREMRGYGFATRVVGHWGGANGNRLVRAANRALVAAGPLALPSARSFRIVGTRI